MRATRKRKQTHPQSFGKSPRTTVNSGGGPFPDHPRPTPEECLSVRDDLLSLHGFPQEFIKYRDQRLKTKSQLKDSDKLEPLVNGGEIDEKESVLDGLVRTILSQNTTELNSERAFASLKNAFPTWQDVLAAESKCIEDAIRCGGLAPTKSSCIKNLLSRLLEKKGKLCMEYLRDLSIDEVKTELSIFKGIGPKTVSCVLMFHLEHDDFPVDTHVFQIAKTMDWVPDVADVKTTYLHLNQRIPGRDCRHETGIVFTRSEVAVTRPGLMSRDLRLLSRVRDCFHEIRNCSVPSGKQCICVSHVVPLNTFLELCLCSSVYPPFL